MSTIDNLFLGSVPATGPRALVMKVVIAPPALTEVDLRQKMDLSLFVGCQAVYVDASNVTSDITMTTSMGQKMTFKKGTQGYYPILEGVAMKFLFASETFQQLDIIFLNQPIAVGVWGESGSEYELPIATANDLGGIKVGDNLTIDGDGVLSAPAPTPAYTLPTASETVLGGVKVGDGLAIVDGVLSATGGGTTQLDPLIITSENSFPSVIEQPAWVVSAVVNGDHVTITVNADVSCDVLSTFITVDENVFSGEDCYTKIVDTFSNFGELPESAPTMVTSTKTITGETLANVFGKVELHTGNEFITQTYDIYINVPSIGAGMVSIQPV